MATSVLSAPAHVDQDLLKEVERLRKEVAQYEIGIADEDGVEYFDADPHPDGLEMSEQALQYSNGDSYEGQTLGNMRHGKGVHICSNGDSYRGYWRLDRRHGRGKASFASGVQYEGDWIDDKAHGRGSARYENGGVFEGEFKAEQRWGWGRHTFPNGDVYEGEWLHDKIQGQGRCTYPDGSYYEGHWAGGERAKGTFVSADGAGQYTGQWRGDLRHGQGVQFVKGLLKYTGEWRGDLQEGQGMCAWADGAEYRGAWRGGQRAGRGVLSRPDGHVYEGEWRAERPHGQGACRADGGDRYDGAWEEGLQHGQGKCVYASGDAYSGAWERGVRCGQGTCLYANRDKYSGGWAGDKRHGWGVCKFADGARFKGEWDADAWVQGLADPSRCRAKGAGLSRAVAGVPSSFAISARDELGNRRLCGGDAFAVHLEGPAGVAGAVADRGNGTYAASYCARLAGRYELSITDDAGAHVADSPYPLLVLPGPASPKHCSASGGGARRAVAGAPARFSLEARDCFGNRCEGADLAEELPLEVTLTGVAGKVALTVAPARSGCYDCSYTAPAAGFYRLEVQSRGRAVAGSPISVRIAPPDLAAAGVGDGDAEHGRPVGQPAADPFLDKVKAWGEAAAAQYAEDGAADGWDSDAGEEETAEEKYIKAHPDVPVVQNMEDMWLVSKLQRERKRREERSAAALAQVGAPLHGMDSKGAKPNCKEGGTISAAQVPAGEVHAAEQRLEGELPKQEQHARGSAAPDREMVAGRGAAQSQVAACQQGGQPAGELAAGGNGIVHRAGVPGVIKASAPTVPPPSYDSLD